MVEINALCFGFLEGWQTVLIPLSDQKSAVVGKVIILTDIPSINQLKEIAATATDKIILLPEISPYSHLAAFIWYKEINVVALKFDWFLYSGKIIHINFELESVLIAQSEVDTEELRFLMDDDKNAGALKQKSTTTANRDTVQILAEISSKNDLEKAFEYGANGIGVIKYEDIFTAQNELEDTQLLNSNDLPSRLLIRFFDLGSEKYTNQKTTNYLGNRGVRIIELDETVVNEFLLKLTPLSHKEIVIILPMVTSVKEVVSFRKNIPADLNYKLGITLETPAAALVLEDFKGVIDFIEIGLNDLTQYTMAWDRDSPNSDRLPAGEIVKPVSKLIKSVVRYCKSNNIEYTLGLDLRPSLKLARQLHKLGVSCISCSPSLIRPWRESFTKLN